MAYLHENSNKVSMAKVSIIVPVYNVERYIDRCMQSLLKQTLKDIEIILVDDGSPDHCPEICDKYAKSDGRIMVIHKQNAGLGYARNSGLEVATSEYIAFLDSDDYVDVNMYKTLFDEITTQDADAVFCGTRKETAEGHYIDQIETTNPIVMQGQGVVNFYLNMIASPPNEKKERLYEMSVWRSLYRKSIIYEYNLTFPSEREWASEDLPFNIQYLSKCNKVILLPDILHTYCINPTSLTKTYHKEKFQRFVNLYYWMVNETRIVDPKKYHSTRFLIGYTRAHLKSLISSGLSRKEKIIILREICSNNVWNDVNYDLSKLPFHAAICQRLLVRKKIGLLYLFIWFFNILR